MENLDKSHIESLLGHFHIKFQHCRRACTFQIQMYSDLIPLEIYSRYPCGKPFRTFYWE